jgi:SAM-dependent methyltransferase
VRDYSTTFFRQLEQGSHASAERVTEICMQLLSPRSVIDVGCGTGAWLAAFAARGVREIDGFDGDYVDRSLLEIPAEAFHAADLELPLSVGRTYDLAVSLEVAEHLSPRRGPSFVADLVALAPVVMFSAAIPHQGGTAHVNERWQDDWAELFARHGYVAHDCIRPAVWDDPQVERWYAQNTLLYADPAIELGCPSQLPLRVVHPGVYLHRAAPGSLSLREAVAHVIPSLRNAGRRRLRRRSPS